MLLVVQNNVLRLYSQEYPGQRSIQSSSQYRSISPQESWKPLVTPHLVEPFPGPLCYQVPGDPLQPPVPVLLPAVGPRARLPAPQASPADQVTPPALVDPSSWYLHQMRMQNVICQTFRTHKNLPQGYLFGQYYI